MQAESFSEFIFTALRQLPSLMGERFLMGCWSIWCRRNDVLWNDGSKSPDVVVRRALNVHDEWLKSRDLRATPSPPPRETCLDSWHPPLDDGLKCNVDAGFFASNNKAGGGALVRDANGNFIKAGIFPFPSLVPVREGEAACLLKAMQWCDDLGSRRIIFETDAKTVKDALGSSEDDDTEFGDIIRNIRLILSQKPLYSVKVIRRQANEAAHVLAQQSRFFTCLTSFDVVPSLISHCMANVCPIIHGNNIDRDPNG